MTLEEQTKDICYKIINGEIDRFNGVVWLSDMKQRFTDRDGTPKELQRTFIRLGDDLDKIVESCAAYIIGICPSVGKNPYEPYTKDQWDKVNEIYEEVTEGRKKIPLDERGIPDYDIDDLLKKKD